MRGTKPQPRRSTARLRERAPAPCDQDFVLAQLQAVLDSVDNALLLVNADGRVQWCNARFRQWMGIEAQDWGACATEEALARRLAPQLSHPDQFLAHRGRPAGQSEEAAWDELELRKPEHRILERLSRPVFDAAGRSIGRLEVYRDITAGRLIHSKLLQTEKWRHWDNWYPASRMS